MTYEGSFDTEDWIIVTIRAVQRPLEGQVLKYKRGTWNSF